MEKLMIVKIMFKPTTTKVIMVELMIIKLIMAKSTNFFYKYGKITMAKLEMFKPTMSKKNWLN